MKKLLLIVLILVACQPDYYEDEAYLNGITPPPPFAIAQTYDFANKVTTTSSDPIFQRMTKGFPVQNCQWQTLYFIGYGVVRVDKIISEIELEMIDWVSINNQLTTEYYKVFREQKLVDPALAVAPGRQLEKGWQWTIVQVNTYKIGVAYLQVPNSSYYQVSFVKFTKYF